MRLRRTALPLAALVALPLALSASAGKASATPTFTSYESPVGATGHQGDLPPAVTDPAPFGIYQQEGIGDSCGEPTLAVDKKSNNILYQCGLQTLLVSGFDKKGKGTSTWTDVTTKVEGEQSSDPILRQDADTGRVWVNQLMPQGCSTQAFTDDFGKTWTQSALGCGPGIAFDHQTIGAGRPVLQGGSVKPVNYPNFLYYCTNDVAAMSCATSLDGGLSYLPARPVYAIDDDCSAIIGHLKAAPDGTVYLMPDGCGSGASATQAVWVSTDNALTWTKRVIPGSTVGDAGHPSIAVGRDNTLYASWGSRDNGTGGRVYVAVSRDRGAHWTKPVAVGKDAGIRVTRFPIAVAGDGDRAVVGYLGSTTAGNPGATASYKGTWRLYLSYTYDRGKHWTTYNATPKSPVQVGSICTGGLGCNGDRNLLDFNDMVLDAKGRVAVALADGCLKVKGCSAKKDRLRKGLVVRQTGGKGLYKKFD